MKFRVMKFEFGQIIVCVHLATMLRILRGVLATTVLLSLNSASINLKLTSFSTKITSGFTILILVLMMLIKASSCLISASMSIFWIPSS